MIELLSPKKIGAIDRPTKEIENGVGWNYALDFHWLFKQLKGVSKDSLILDVGCGDSPFHTFAEDRLGLDIKGIDRSEGFCHQPVKSNMDYEMDFMDCEIKNADVVYWLSSIEHNNLDTIKKLYNKSLEVMKPGGLLLITFPVSKRTYWFEPSQQTNLSIEDASLIFGDKVRGDFEKVHSEYQNYMELKDKYIARYGGFGKEDPAFIVGALS